MLEEKLVELIGTGALSYGSLVWRRGFADWAKLEVTELKVHLALSLLDECKLKAGGTDTSKFSRRVVLVPIYLYQRARALEQHLAYFCVWMASFFLMWFL